ncbi:MAG: hypothetical protein CL945_04980 [Dinoroseobacter sp.]|nr:hypothetical protein [Dinoroseobacter sp.]
MNVTLNKTFTLVALTLTMALAGTAGLAQQASRAEPGGFSENTPGGGGGHGGASDLAGFDAGGRNPQAVIHDSDAQLDVWTTLCNDAGGGMSTDETGNYTCTDSNGNEIEDY